MSTLDDSYQGSEDIHTDKGLVTFWYDFGSGDSLMYGWTGVDALGKWHPNYDEHYDCLWADGYQPTELLEVVKQHLEERGFKVQRN